MVLRKRLAKFTLLLVFISLACDQAGDILTIEEATERARPSPTVVILELDVAEFDVGDEVIIVGGSSGALVPLFGNAGDRFFSSQVMAGEDAVVLGLQDIDGVVWYQVEGLMGAGWLEEEHLAPPEGE